MKNQSNFGSYLTGFTCGVLAGAAGYFLFGTKEGKKLRESFQEEWEDVKDHFVEQGVTPHRDFSISEVFEFITSKIKDGFTPDRPKPLFKFGSPEPEAKPAKKKKTTRFKGV